MDLTDAESLPILFMNIEVGAHLLQVQLCHMGGCQTYNPFWGIQNFKRCIIIGTQKGTNSLTTTHIHRYIYMCIYIHIYIYICVYIYIYTSPARRCRQGFSCATDAALPVPHLREENCTRRGPLVISRAIRTLNWVVKDPNLGSKPLNLNLTVVTLWLL